VLEKQQMEEQLKALKAERKKKLEQYKQKQKRQQADAANAEEKSRGTKKPAQAAKANPAGSESATHLSRAEAKVLLLTKFVEHATRPQYPTKPDLSRRRRPRTGQAATLSRNQRRLCEGLRRQVSTSSQPKRI
jgi:hypothetical protein